MTTHSMYPNGTCPNCGGPLLGDGYKTVLHCEFADSDSVSDAEPDAKPVLCNSDDVFDHETFIEGTTMKDPYPLGI